MSFKAIKYESVSLNTIVSDKSHRAVVALNCNMTTESTPTYQLNRDYVTKI